MSTTTPEPCLEWKSTGSKFLAKMGWKEGQGVGKRHREIPTATLSVKKRSQGRGLGASANSSMAIVDTATHDLSRLLSDLQATHGKQKAVASESEGSDEDDEDVKRKKKKSKKKRKEEKREKSSSSTMVLPTNRVTHAGIREAKFRKKTAEEMKCIFGGVVVGQKDEATSTTKRKREKCSHSKKKKRAKQGES